MLSHFVHHMHAARHVSATDALSRQPTLCICFTQAAPALTALHMGFTVTHQVHSGFTASQADDFTT
jgi:hypothetical protein